MSTVAVRQISSETGSEDFDGVIARMQNKAPAAVNRPAVPDDEVTRLAGEADRFLLVHDAELHQKVREQHLLRLIDDQAHRAFVAMGADVDYRASEAVILHARHGDEELVVQKSADCGFFLPQ